MEAPRSSSLDLASAVGLASLQRPVMAEVQQERMGFHELWSILKRNLGLFLGVLVVVMAISTIINFRLEKRYSVQATIALELADTRVNLSDAMIVATETNQAEIETELDIMRSREFAGKVADSLQLMEDASFNPFLLGPLTVTVDPEVQRDAVIGNLLKVYSLARSGESLAIDINVSHKNPVTAAAIANAIAQQYIDESVAFKRSVANQSIDFLRNRVAALSESLNASEIQIATFIRANSLDNIELPARLRAELDRQTSILELSKSGQYVDQDIAPLEDAVQKIETQLRDRTRSELMLRQMERTLETERNRFQTYVERLNSLEAQVDILAPGGRQVSTAEPPNLPSWPNIPLALLASLGGGLGLAVVATLIKESMNRRVWSETHASRVTDLPTIAQIPRIQHRASGKQVSIKDYLATNPRSAFSEAVRSLFTLCYHRRRRSEGMVLMVASGLPNEGKSTIALALAHCTASGGLRALLIDLDSRRHGLTKLLELGDPIHKLEDIWSDKALLHAAIRRNVLCENFDVLTFQQESTLPWRMMFDPEAARTMEALRSLYDVIILDTPPVLLVDDASRLASITDEAILVTRWGKTAQEVLRDSAEIMRKNGIPVIGTVINDVDIRKQLWYGYGGHASYYAQGDDYFQ